MQAIRLLKLASSVIAGATVASQAAAFTLPAAGYVQYGDAQSYSLPLLAYLCDQGQLGCVPPDAGGGTGPGNPYYVVSTPGAIKDLIVIATGTDSNPATTNFSGMDNAEATPNSSGIPFFTTTETPTDPGQVGGAFFGDQQITWDATVASLNTFLAGEAPIFFFNNNQTNSGGQATESLAAWARVTLTNDSGTVIGTYDFTNNGAQYLPFFEGGGGVPNGSAAAYTSTGAAPNAGTNASTDYVLSGGKLCLTSLGALKNCSGATLLPDIDFDPNNGLQPEVIVEEFAHNLGANQAAYAIVFPELNAQLAGLIANQALDLTKYTMHMDIRMGCDPAASNGGGNYNVCTGEGWGYGRGLNNGYEQIFLGKASTVVNVPEPASLALLGLGMLGLGLKGRRYKPS